MAIDASVKVNIDANFYLDGVKDCYHDLNSCQPLSPPKRIDEITDFSSMFFSICHVLEMSIFSIWGPVGLKVLNETFTASLDGVATVDWQSWHIPNHFQVQS